MRAPRHTFTLVALLPLLLLGCGSPPTRPASTPATITQAERLAGAGTDVAFYALALIDTGYRFGGKNPEAGLDCSGMVSYIYREAAGLQVHGSAADIARHGREIQPEALRPGDLVFFNTRGFAHSHVGIYIGEQRFVHAPKSNARVRVDRLNDRYYAQRFVEARTYFD